MTKPCLRWLSLLRPGWLLLWLFCACPSRQTANPNPDAATAWPDMTDAARSAPDAIAADDATNMADPGKPPETVTDGQRPPGPDSLMDLGHEILADAAEGRGSETLPDMLRDLAQNEQIGPPDAVFDGWLPPDIDANIEETVDAAEATAVDADADETGSAPDAFDAADRWPEPDTSPACDLCDDGDVCNGQEWCDPAVGCMPGNTLLCDDGDDCNGSETCAPTSGCTAGLPLICDDGQWCNGVETCVPALGCLAGSPPDCDDRNACNGRETCVAGLGCVSAGLPTCPVAPPECEQSGGSGGPTAGVVVNATVDGLWLYDENQWDSAAAILDAIEADASVTRVSLATVLQDLNRTGQRVTTMSDVACFSTGYQWNSGDTGVAYWTPQGIAGTATAYPDGTYNGRKISLVTWYHDPDADPDSAQNKGIRASIADATDLDNLSYRLALLVEPYWNGTTPDYRPIAIHAGGVAWYRDLLYVADTSNGFRVFDLSRILRVQTGNGEWVGRVSTAEGYHAFNYRYVIPQVTRYRRCPQSCCMRFSFAEVDLTGASIAILSGEYTADSLAGRLHRWPLDADSGRLLATNGRVEATQTLFPGVYKMQGGLTWNGHVFISSSQNSGTLYSGTPGHAMTSHAWPYVPEDLHYSPFSDNLWCLTEQADTRTVFAVKMADILEGCR